MSGRPDRSIADDTVGDVADIFQTAAIAYIKCANNTTMSQDINDVTDLTDDFYELDKLSWRVDDAIFSREIDLNHAPAGFDPLDADSVGFDHGEALSRKTSDYMRSKSLKGQMKGKRDEKRKQGTPTQDLSYAAHALHSSWESESQMKQSFSTLAHDLYRAGGAEFTGDADDQITTTNLMLPTLRGDNYHLTALATVNEARSSLDTHESLVDNGANINIVGPSVSLTNERQSPYLIVDMAGNKSAPSTAGEYTMEIDTEDGSAVGIQIKNAQRIDSAPNNLISLSGLTKQRFRFEFDVDGGRMFTPTCKRVDLVERDGLYWLKWRSPDQSPIASASSAGTIGRTARDPDKFDVVVESREDIHKIFCHINNDTTLEMGRHGELGFVSRRRYVECSCRICALYKATRQPSGRKRTQPTDFRPFQIISSDLKGPFPPDFWGNIYWIIFVDYRTGWVNVYAMKHKSEAWHYTQQYLIDIKLMNKDFAVERFHTDNGGEYNATEFKEWLRCRCIRQTFTSAHTPYQNGTSERMNRTLIEAVRSMLAEAKLSHRYWSLAAKHFTYILNRIYRRRLKVGNVPNSPYKLIFGKSADLSTLKVWGSSAVMWVHGTGPLEASGKEVIYVGEAADKKGRAVFDPATKTIHTTTHVKFLRGDPSADILTDQIDPSADFGVLEDDEVELSEDDVASSGDTPPGGAEIASADNEVTEPQSREFTPREIRVSERQRNSNQAADSSSQSESSAPKTRDKRAERLQTLRSDDKLQCPVVPARTMEVKRCEKLTEQMIDLIKIAHDFDMRIEFQSTNPKVSGTKCHGRYELYKRSQTIRSMIQHGGTKEDFKNDFSFGYVRILQPTPAEWDQLLERKLKRMEVKGTNLAQYIEAGYLEQSTICDEISPEQFRFALVASTLLNEDPQSVEEAKLLPDWPKWEEAMMEEVQGNLIQRECLVPMTDEMWQSKPADAWTYVSPKWVFKRKYNADGSLQRYKARLVVKGYKQEWGKDYDETFAPVFAYSTMRTVLSIANQHDLRVDSFDIANAFIQCDLDREHLLMKCPPGLDIRGADGKKIVYRLCKALYGLKQSARMLSETLKTLITSFGFTQLSSDQSAFIKGHGCTMQILLVWVDDMLLFTPRDKDDMREQFQHHMSAALELSEYTGGETKIALGINITRVWSEGTLKIDVHQAIEKLAKKFNVDERAKKYKIPMPYSTKLTKPAESDIVPESEFQYMSAVGALLYITMTARPDIAYATGQLSRFMAYPSRECVDVAKQTICYLYHTRYRGITYLKTPHARSLTQQGIPENELQVYVDASWANDTDTSRSVSGHVFLLYGGIVDWSSRLQSMVATSTSESEVIAACEAVKRLKFTRILLRELQLKQHFPTHVMEDNSACFAFVNLFVNVRKVRHYLARVRFLQDEAMFGTFEFQRVASADQLADVMTKPLDSTLFNKCIRGFGMDDTPETQSYSQSPSYGGANAHDIQGAAAQTIVEQPLERKRKTSAQPSIKAKPTSATVNHVDVCVGSAASPDTLTPHSAQHQTYTVLIPGYPRPSYRC